MATSTESWNIAGASVQGTRHVRSGLPCQDSVQYRTFLPAYPNLPEDTLIIAVADGAGSAPRADEGSYEAAKQCVRTAFNLVGACAGNIDAKALESILNRSVIAARQHLEHMVMGDDSPLGAFATTLILLVHAEGAIGAAQIGDGAVVVSDGTGNFRLLTAPQRGEYANETNFLTSSNARHSLQIKVEERFDGENVALFTDGIQSLVVDYSAQKPHAPFFSGAFTWLHSQRNGIVSHTGLTEFLKSRMVSARTDDDITLVLATLQKEKSDDNLPETGGRNRNPGQAVGWRQRRRHI